MVTAAAEQKTAEAMEQTARRYLEDILYDILLTKDEPTKMRDIVAGVQMEGATQRLIRDILSGTDRFEQTERKWTLAGRYVDTQRPMQRIIARIMDSCSRPMSLSEIAREMAVIYGRPPEYYEEILPRLLVIREYYFSTGEDMYGRSDWLIVASDNEDDVLFDSFIDQEDIKPYAVQAGKAKWTDGDPLAGALDFLKKVNAPVPGKILQFFAWKADPASFDAEEFYTALAHSDDFLLLYGQKVAHGGTRKELEAWLKDYAAKLEDMQIEGEEDEAEGPVEVTEADLQEIVRLILAEEGPSRAEELLDTVFEVAPGEKAYDGALQTVIESLRSDHRVLWVGDGRWRTPESVPDHVLQIPSGLTIPTFDFVTPEGEVLDQELEDDGFDSALKNDMKAPLLMDVGDEDPIDAKKMQPLGDRQRCVLKYHHKDTGTFPLCQINPEFFGTDPVIMNVTLVHEGVRRELWLNNETRLIYDMKDWYATEMPVSGAVFYFEKTEKPDEFRFVYESETDDKLFVQPNRLLELLELKEKAESHEMPTTDIIVTIMERYKQGIEFGSLLTEVNLVRRCARRLIASILSSYRCFYTPKNSTVWRYDEEKWSEGFNKAKRKYIKKK